MATSRPSAERVILVGMMGAGKTSIGQRLAERLGWRYLDSDDQVERNTGRTVPEIFETDGEAAFRSEEGRALAEAVTRPEPSVVAAAGGAVLDRGNRELLRRAGPVVWLRAQPATLAARVGNGAGRPLLSPDPAEALPRLDAERRPFYAEVADVVVDVDDLTPDQVVDRILAALQ
jgi:shikimate kinase